MARFQGTVQGTRGKATRLGTTQLEVRANSWEAGIFVRVTARRDGGNEFEVHMTGGSGGGEVRRLVGTLHEFPFGKTEWIPFHPTTTTTT
jgi:hypothetical protein